MNIVIATDDNYIQHCSVMVTSVLENNKDAHFFVLTEGLTDMNKSILKDIAERYNSTIDFCIVDSNIVKHFPMPADGGDHISIATYYRLLIEYLIPSSIDKVIYMDCDIVVRGDLSELYNIDLEGKALGAVYQNVIPSTKQDLDRLMMSEELGYFNAGVLLINLKYWRENDVTKRLLNFIKCHFTLIKQHDQDTLNSVLQTETQSISYRWNFLPLFYSVKNPVFPSHVVYEKDVEPSVIHYVCAPKPWDYGCNNPYRCEYDKYLQLTPFKGAKKNFNFRRFSKDVIKPWLIRAIIMFDPLNLRKVLR